MNTCIERITKEKVIPVIKIDLVEQTLPILDALKEGGITVAEITFRTACAPEAIALATQERTDILVGAGTIINGKQAKKAIDAGAKFIVSPGFSVSVAKCCKKRGVPYVPGCISPTEIMSAMAQDIEIVKFFPAENYGGINTMKALSAAFPAIRFIPTGGISKGNIKQYLAFDKVVACGASSMVKADLIKNGDYEKITQLSKEIKEAIL